MKATALPLQQLQWAIQSLYRIDCDLDVRDFVISGEQKRAIVGERASPLEELLVVEDGEDLLLALFLDDSIANDQSLSTLPFRNWPLQKLCIVIEGVSHFVYLAWKAQNRQSATAVELEIQAEVDKFLLCVYLLGLSKTRHQLMRLHRAMFRKIVLRAQPDRALYQRYHDANQLADRYCEFLIRRFLTSGPVVDLNQELRRFYRRGPRKVAELSAM